MLSTIHIQKTKMLLIKITHIVYICFQYLQIFRNYNLNKIPVINSFAIKIVSRIMDQNNQTFEIPESNQENQNKETNNLEPPQQSNIAPDPNIMTAFPPHSHPPLPKLSENQKKQYAPSHWNQFFDELFYLDDGTSVFSAGKQGPLYLCIHGAGHSALSFACLAKQVKNYGTLVAFDFKGHGESKNEENLQDFSIQAIVKQSLNTFANIVNRESYKDKNIIMVGHSMGGSVCARVTDILTNQQKNERVHGMVIIDVVEGTAIQALPYMNQILNDRPQYFDCVQSAIKWSLSSGTLKKSEAARVSIPPQLKLIEHNGLKYYTWKVNLKLTEKYWLDWFKNLSKIFLKIHIAKVLVTAQKERLDKELTIAQMQGKFKLTILYNVGHSVQQDDYKGMARMLNQFIHDFRIPMDIKEVEEKKTIGIAKFAPHIKPYKGTFEML